MLMKIEILIEIKVKFYIRAKIKFISVSLVDFYVSHLFISLH